MDKLLAKLMSLKQLTIQDVEDIIDKVSSILFTEPTLLNISAPVNIVGDIHGQYDDLMIIFERMGHLPHSSYLFLGDYVDRGSKSLETILLLFLLKILYPSRIFLLRGNHESEKVNRTYGFYDEVLNKHGSIKIWKLIQLAFDLLPIAAIIDGRFICTHGGISPSVLAISGLKRAKKELSPMVLDIIWSDPGERGWVKSPRGLGYLYGSDVTTTFLEVNGLKSLIRSHQLVNKGFSFHFPEENAVTVWSATDYCGRCGNDGSVLTIGEDHVLDSSSFTLFYPKK